MTAKVIGHIVICNGQPMYQGDHNVLWFGSAATLFSTRGEATAAINRSKDYGRKKKYEWQHLENVKIFRVTEDSHAAP